MRRLAHPLALLAAITIAACTPAPQTGGNTGATPTTGEKRAENQALRVAQTGIPASLSPETSSTNIPFFAAMYDAPVTFAKNFEIRPQAAEKWEYRSGVWIFTLRSDLKFNDGTPLTAEDFAFTLNLIAEKKLPQTTYLGNLKSARVVDLKTVEVSSTAPDATLLNGMPWAFILPKTYYEKVGKDQFGVKPMGSGPYEAVEFSPSVRAKFKLKTSDHPFRKPIAPEVTFQALPEQSAVVGGIRTGDIDITSTVSFTAENADTLAREGNKVLTLKASNMSVLMPQVENRARNTPLTNKLVRQAISYAIDRETIAKNLYRGLAEPAYQLSIPGSEMWIDGYKAYPYDPKKAKELLALAGYPNGFKLPVGIDFTNTVVAEQLPLAFQGYLREIGIETEITHYEIGAFLDKFYGRNGQTRGDFMFWSSGDSDGVSAQYRGRLHCDQPTSGIWWCNEQFVKLFDQSRSEPDVKKRSELVQQAHRVILDDVAFINMIVQPLYVVHGKNIRGVDFTTPLIYNFDAAYRVQ